MKASERLSSIDKELEENLNVVARFIGRAVGVRGDLDALGALSTVKAGLEIVPRIVNIVEAMEKIAEAPPRTDNEDEKLIAIRALAVLERKL